MLSLSLYIYIIPLNWTSTAYSCTNTAHVGLLLRNPPPHATGRGNHLARGGGDPCIYIHVYIYIIILYFIKIYYILLYCIVLYYNIFCYITVSYILLYNISYIYINIYICIQMVMEREKYMFVYSYLLLYNNKLPIAYAVLGYLFI